MSLTVHKCRLSELKLVLPNNVIGDLFAVISRPEALDFTTATTNTCGRIDNEMCD